MPAINITHSHGGPCSCCGSATATTRGEVDETGLRVARYLVRWTVGDPAHGMSWLVSLCSLVPSRDVCITLLYSFEHRSFMVLSPEDYIWPAEETQGFGEMLQRSQVIGTPLAQRVFDIVDDIWLTDRYVKDFVALAEAG